MSLITLIPEDKTMTVDGHPMKFDLGLDDNIWAIQWDGSKGHIEYNDGSPNKDITEFPELESLTAKHTQVKNDAEAKVVADEKKRIDAMTYADKRKSAYNRLPNQLEMIYDDKVNGTNKWVEAIAEIKKLFPKPE